LLGDDLVTEKKVGADSNTNTSRCAFTKAVCLDLPYILDSVWRHQEYDINREFDYVIPSSPGAGNPHGAGNGEPWLQRRRYLTSPAFYFLLLTVVFVAYGPTLDSLCSVLGPQWMREGRGLLGGAVLVGALMTGYGLASYGRSRIARRFENANPPAHQSEHWRHRFVKFFVGVAVALPVLAMGLFGWFLIQTSDTEICHRVPSLRPGWLQLIATSIAMGVIVFWSFNRSLSRARRANLHAVLLLALGAVLWGAVAPPWASEANQSPYFHVYGAFACLLAVLTMLAPWLALWLVGTVEPGKRTMYQDALKTTELFPPAGSRRDPEFSGRRFWAALFTGTFYNFLHFLLLPSFFALIVPSRWLLWTFAIGLGVSGWLLMTGSFTSRWQVMLDQVRRWFLAGTPLAVSVGVIGLAMLRLARVQYVATVLDAAPFGVIFTWIVMTYALLWWFEFSINGSIAAELLGVLDPAVRAKHTRPTETDTVVYPATAIPPAHRNVEQGHRYITVHGAGRFVALGWFPGKDGNGQVTREKAFQAFDLLELFSTLTPPRALDFFHDLRRRIQLYFLTLNGVIVAVLFATYVLYYGSGDTHNTVQSVVNAKAVGDQARLFNLAESLKIVPSDPAAARSSAAATTPVDNGPAYIVAASGGGTRAALYTATALEGLQRLDVARHIVLLSGVSGGGVALAYFYAHRPELLAQHTFPNEPWTRFKRSMAEPFIGDVLEGAGEWRVLSRQPLGNLLVESFERRLFDKDGGQAAFSDDRVGLILNTTITAHPQEDSDLLRNALAPPADADGSCDSLHPPYAMVGGGRLIFTNLRDPAAFPSSGSRPPTDSLLHIPDVRLPYVVVRDPDVTLAKAAALNANFPPVFTNARVDVVSEVPDPVCPSRAYYVTDGGANENLGLVSALYALRGALQEVRKPPADPHAPLRPVQIVTIEASASSYDYTPDRGIGAATDGAKERLTGGVTQELLNEVETSIAGTTPDPQGIQIHHLALPLAFRSRGGFGTHWMFPEYIVVTDPRRAAPLKWYKEMVPAGFFDIRPRVTLNKDELFDLWTALYDPDNRFCSVVWHKSKQSVADWICARYPTTPDHPLKVDLQIDQWQQLVDAARKKPL
jgi:hypothetical protein